MNDLPDPLYLKLAHILKGEQSMTGKEWYDRFEEHLVGNVAWLTSSPGTIKEKVLDAARKAAGLEE